MAKKKMSGLQIAAYVLFIFSCLIFLGPGRGLGLLWMIPMTVHYRRATTSGRGVGIGFGICSLIFVSVIGGILVLCDSSNRKKGKEK